MNSEKAGFDDDQVDLKVFTIKSNDVLKEGALASKLKHKHLCEEADRCCQHNAENMQVSMFLILTSFN